MLLAAALRARLAAEVPALASRVAGAADLQRLLAENRLPQAGLSAVVIPGGMRGGPMTAVLGAFRQIVVRRAAVLLVARAPDPATGRAADELEALAEATVAALAGWTPDETTPGVLRLESAALRALPGGTLLYELLFALDDAAPD